MPNLFQLKYLMRISFAGVRADTFIRAMRALRYAYCNVNKVLFGADQSDLRYLYATATASTATAKVFLYFKNTATASYS